MTISTRALRDAHAATTPGTWRASGSGDYCDEVWCGADIVADVSDADDVAFIVLAHEQVPALLDEVDELRVLVSMEKAYAEKIQALHDLQVSLTAIATDGFGRANAEVESLRAEVARLKAVIQEDAVFTAHRPGAK